MNVIFNFERLVISDIAGESSEIQYNVLRGVIPGKLYSTIKDVFLKFF